VKWTPGTENDDVVDQRGSGGGGGGGGGGFGAMHLTGGGLAALVVVVVVARVFGVDISGLLGGDHRPAPSQVTPPSRPHPPAGTDPDKQLVDFVKFVMKDIQSTFETGFKASGQPYRHAKLVLFTDAIDTGCGRSSAAIGPFYCPADEHAYIDLSFYRELRERFGAPGDFAQAYVLAHEVGHHVQDLLGLEEQFRRAQEGRPSQAKALSVRFELQADCFAGVWAHSTQQRNILEAGDVEEAMAAAAAVGDDRIQKEATGRVNPETWTHGSSRQRMQWFKTGLTSGRIPDCDTFRSGAAE